MEPQWVLDLLADTHGVRWSLSGHVPGGGEGTFLAETGTGLVAFKISTHPGAFEEHSARVALIEPLRRSGYPLPRHHQPILLPGGLVLRPQDWIPGGSPPGVLTHQLVDDLWIASSLQADAAPDGMEDWGSFLRTTLTEGANGWCLHQTLRDVGGRPAQLLRRIAAIHDQTLPAQFPSRDVMHLDLHDGNLLQRRGLLHAVVDWGGARAGDRWFDFVTLAFASRNVEPGVQQRLWDLVEVPDDQLAVYVAHMALRLVDGSLRYRPTEVDYWLDHSNAMMDRFA